MFLPSQNNDTFGIEYITATLKINFLNIKSLFYSNVPKASLSSGVIGFSTTTVRLSSLR